ncbi:MAG TPA: type II and III secretion system protein, partial [Chthoniobacterales bacterium]|nr:type II and III secretion system protein [Chthoniobacterales bacterium]
MNTPLLYFASFVSLLVLLPSANRLRAQNVRSVAEHEVARRKTAIVEGQHALVRAQVAMEAKDFKKAHDQYRIAVSFFPDSVVTGSQHDAALKGFCESGVKLARQRIGEGKYGESEQIVREVVSDRYDPNYRPALELLGHLRDPGYFNKTTGPKFIARVEDVRKLLNDAEGYYQSGRYDLAMKKYEQVLNLDPYNIAARRGEERI